MNEFIIGGLVVLFVAVLPCLVCGYLIAYRGRRNLISGWNDTSYSNPERASKIVGISLIIMALLLALSTVFWSTQIINEVTLLYSVIPVAVVPILALVYVKIKFKK